MPPRITAAIVAGNEEDRIAGAVRSAAWADEVLVLDSESADRTAAIARAEGARVVVEPWRGYGAQKNRAAELALHDWILSLDADERTSPELAAAVAALPEDPDEAAFAVRRRNYFAGRPIRHWPWSWERVVRLYDRRRARFSERRVHESLEVEGRVGELAGVIEHFTYRGWDDYRERRRRYARLGAEEALARGRRPRPGDTWARPAATLLRHLLGRGYLIGGPLGWRLAWESARGTRMKYAELGRLWAEREGGR